MGFIPIFITLGGACLLFFLTVRNSMQRKLNKHHELLQELRLKSELTSWIEESSTLNDFFEKLKSKDEKLKISKKELSIIRELKVNRVQYNNLIKKAPYNWVAKISGLQSIA